KRRLTGIEIKQYKIRSIETSHPRQPWVKRERTLIHQVQQRFLIIHQRVLNRLPIFAFNHYSRNPRWIIGRGILLPEMRTALLQTIRQALQRHRTISEMGDETLGYSFIKAQHISFCYSKHREKRLFFVREFQGE